MATEKRTIVGKVIDFSKGAITSVLKRSKYLLTSSPFEIWKKDIRPKIPLGNPDVTFDLKEHKSTEQDYGVSFSSITKKKGHEKDVIIGVPEYKLHDRSTKQFEAWLESSEDDKKNENFIPASSDKKKLSNDEQEAYDNLIKLYELLKEKNGSIKIVPVSPGSLKNKIVIEIDVSNKTFEQIEDEMKQYFEWLGLSDSEMVETAAKRLYDGANNQAISSDEPFAKQKPESSQEPVQVFQNPNQKEMEENVESDEEVIEEGNNLDKNSEKQDLSEELLWQIQNTKPAQVFQDPNQKGGEENVESDGEVIEKGHNLDKDLSGEQTQNTKPEEQMDSQMPSSQFSLTIPPEFPSATNVISFSQVQTEPHERQGELVSRHQSFKSEISTNLNVMDNNIKNQVIEISEDLSDVSLNSTSKNSSAKQLPSSIQRNDSIRNRG